ncbi:MAG: M23 family metallopeptidase [Porticoccaceae bacterium]|nr:M23 family metallopeptidase [Porticoccaceae bacterium]
MSSPYTASTTPIALLAIFLCALSTPANSADLVGQWIEGGLIFGNTEPGSSVSFKGEPVQLSTQGLFVLGLHRDEDEPVTLSIELPDGSIEEQVFEVAQRDYNIQSIEGIAQNIMEPSEEDQDRIWADYVMTSEARKIRSDLEEFLSDFDWPVRGPISGVYGSQRIYNGKPGTPHYGLDIAVATGTPVVAPAAGRIIMVHDDMFYSGGTIMLDHGHGVSSSFLHLSKTLVAVGDWVDQGDPIAEVGATGRVTGAHLDWRMNWGNSRVDPELLLRASGAWDLD